MKYYQARVAEIALYGDHDPSDFRPPYLVRHWSVLSSFSPPPLTPGHTWAITTLVRCLHGMLEVFCGMEREAAVSSPITNYTRTFHALIVLMILHMATLRSGNELQKLMDEEQLKLSHYFDSLGKALARFAGDKNLRVPFKFLHVLRRLHSWWIQACSPDIPAEGDRYLRPLLDLRSASQANAANRNELLFEQDTPRTDFIVDFQSISHNSTISESEAHSLMTSSRSPYPNETTDSTAVIDRLLCLDPHYEDPFVPAAMTEEETAKFLDDLGANTEMSFLQGYDPSLPGMDYQYL